MHLADTKIGIVTHFYDKIGVAIIELQTGMKVGDKIKFVRGGEDLFEQIVESIQIEHEEIQNAKKGDIIGLKTKNNVKEGAEIFEV